VARAFENNINFESVFKEYFNPLVNYVNQQINDWESSREIVQNTFLKIWKIRDTLEIDTSLKAYLYRTTKNGMIDHIRKSKKNEEVKQVLLKNQLNHQEEELDSFTIKHEIVKAIQKLKPKNRRIFELSKFEGLTHKEIAEYLDISQRSVEDNISRALSFLQKELAENEYFLS